MHRVKNVETKPDHLLSVTFEEGTTGEFNLAGRLDLAPDALYNKLKAAQGH